MNQYDNVELNIAQLLEEQNARFPAFDPQARSGDHFGIVGACRETIHYFVIFMLCRSGLYRRLLYANIILSWFDEFRCYWVRELKNRPIEIHDFYYLLGTYRSRFQEVAVPDLANDQQHLAAWQDPRNIYLLFSNQYKVALDPLGPQRFVKYIPRGSSVCEYGSGFAPVTTFLCKFYARLDLRITCVDIQNVLLHFIRWKFKEKRFIHILESKPGHGSPLEEEYDVLFCTTVFEHLPRPLHVVKDLHAHIKKGGYFIFDYIKSEGKGLDTRGGLDERLEVLRFIKDGFDLIEGELYLDGRHVRTVVCRKR